MKSMGGRLSLFSFSFSLSLLTKSDSPLQPQSTLFGGPLYTLYIFIIHLSFYSLALMAVGMSGIGPKGRSLTLRLRLCVQQTNDCGLLAYACFVSDCEKAIQVRKQLNT